MSENWPAGLNHVGKLAGGPSDVTKLAGGPNHIGKLLLTTGKADVNSKNRYGWTPLSLATSNGHEAVVKMLLARVRPMSTWRICTVQRRCR
jgi:hypothetical protein